jgi:hypothetical protein
MAKIILPLKPRQHIQTSAKLNQKDQLPAKKQNEKHKELVKQDRCANLKDRVTYDLLRWMYILNARGSSLLGDDLLLNS